MDVVLLRHLYRHTDPHLCQALALLVPLLIGVAYLTYAERKVLAAMQLRKGPTWSVHSACCSPSPMRIKMLMKETIIPSGANRLLFIMAPMLTFMLAMIAWAVIPVNDGLGHRRHQCRDTVSVRDLLARRLWHHHRRLGVNSKYAFLGALRSAAQMVSYEVSMGFVSSLCCSASASLNLTDIVPAQRHVWFCCRCFRCSSSSSFGTGGDQPRALRSAGR